MENPPPLLPCPFCGGNATYEEVSGGVDNMRWSVGCKRRFCQGYMTLVTHARRIEAAVAWNKRYIGDADTAPDKREAMTAVDTVEHWRDLHHIEHSHRCQVERVLHKLKSAAKSVVEMAGEGTCTDSELDAAITQLEAEIPCDDCLCAPCRCP